ncbi:MAG: tetratricopeptide repeat protein [Nitrospinota bacterium]
MAHLVFIFSLLVLNIFFTNPAWATYPSPDIAHWELSVSDERNDPDYKEIENLVKEKKLDEALSALDKKIKDLPKEATPVILKALVQLEKGMPKESLDTLLMGFKMERQHPALHFAFCQIHRKLGNGKTSNRACIIASQQHHKNPLAHHEYALTLIAMGDSKSALKELSLAEQLDPKNPTYPYERGMIFIYLNKNKEAEEAFKKSFSLDEKNIEAAYQLAYLYATQNKKELSNTYINKILDMRMNHPKTNSVKLLREIVNTNSTQKLPKKVNTSQYHLSRSKSLYKEKKYGLALIEIETAARFASEDLKTQEILVGMYSLFLRLDKAEEAVSRFIETAKDDKLKSRGYQEWGDIAILRGKLKEAKEYFETAKNLGDPQDIAKLTLAEFPDLDTPIKEVPLNPNEIFINPVNSLKRKGEIFAHFGMYQRALGIHSMILRMEPTHLETLLNMATVNFKLEKYNRAISILERLLVIHPNHENILAHRLLLARSYVKKGDLGSGLKNVDMAIKLNPSSKQVIAADPVFEKLRGLEGFQKLMN